MEMGMKMGAIIDVEVSVLTLSLSLAETKSLLSSKLSGMN